MKKKMRRGIQRIICFVVILAMLSQENLQTVMAWSDPSAATEQQTEDTVLSGEENDLSAGDAVPPAILSEVEDKRGEFSKEYLLSDNSRMMVVYSQQVHYETDDGNLAEIDNSLVKTEEGYENGSNSYAVVITDNEDSQGEVIYREGDYEISWQMVELADEPGGEEVSLYQADSQDKKKDKTSKEEKKKNKEDKKAEKKQKKIKKPQLDAVVTDNTPDGQVTEGEEGIHQVKQSKISLAGYSNDVSVEYEPLGDGIKENIILATKDSGNEYVFCVRLSGLGARLSSNNEIEFYDRDTDEIKYYFPAPFMYDNGGEVSYKARYELVDINAEAGEEADPETGTDPEAEGESESESEPETETEPESEGESESESEPETETEPESESESESESEFESESEAVNGTVITNTSVVLNKPETKKEKKTKPETGMETESQPETETEAETETESEPETGTESETETEAEPETESEPETDPETEMETEAGVEPASADEDCIYIKIVLDEQWLEQAAYPVTVDPVLKQARAKNLLDYGCIASDGTKYDTLYVGRRSGVTYRSYVRFDLPEMDKQCIVSEARLDIGGVFNENTHYIQASMVDEEWYDHAEKKSGKALAWSKAPKLGDLLDYTTNGGYFNITKAVRKWQSGEKKNFGVAFTAYDETVNTRDAIRLETSVTYPYLKITYRTATGLESYWGTHSVAAGSAGAGYINNYTGALTVVNTDVVTAGIRFPISIGHVYNSNATDENNGWRINYAQTVKVPLNTMDVKTYPYVYTDEDGTEHYFKRNDTTFLQNGSEKTVSGGATVPAARDEDGLKLYIVPVTEAALKDKYPIKMIDKSSSLIRYFDAMGRLTMISDSNQHESGKNSSTKEKNCVIINYESYGSETPLTAFDEAVEAATKFYNVCYATNFVVDSAEYIEARDRVNEALNVLKKDVYATSDIATAKKVNAAATELANLTDATTTPSKAAAKSRASATRTALEEARKLVKPLYGQSSKRIHSITDAVGNEAVFTYDADGNLSTISDPTYEGGKVNRYTYDKAGNLTKITFADGKNAYYSYDENHLLTSQKDNDGYRIEYTYSQPAGRIVKVEEAYGDTPGQTYTIRYDADNTTTFRFSGVDDVYGNNDDIENVYVFDEQGREVCVYSKPVNEDKVLGAAACTYAEETSSNDVRNKIKDSAVVGMHANNLLTNHSFEYSDSIWTLYKNENQTPETGALSAFSTSKKYIGTHSAYVNMAKRTGGTAGFKQETKELAAGTYTLSGYCTAASIKNTKAYLKIKTKDGAVYTSDIITQDTDAEFDNGWERLEITFTIDKSQPVTVYLETDCGTSKGAGTVAFDCIQLETGTVANAYNILEDGSFELTENTLPYQWKNLNNSTIKKQDERVEGEAVDGSHSYHITGQPGKDKYLRFSTNLGSAKNGYVLSGWVKSNTTPIRTSRFFRVKAKHEETGSDGEQIKYEAFTDINAYSEGWKYFCVLLPARSWKGTTITICFYDNIGDLYIDGLQLTRNDVQTKSYDASGRLTSRYTAMKTAKYGYDGYHRLKSQTSAAGATSTYSYDTNNEVKQISSNIGPNTYFKYDKYGNQISTSVYDPDATTKRELYSEKTYTADGNFEKTSTDYAGNVTSYEYNSLTGQLTRTTLPRRGTEKAVETKYLYDSQDRITGVTQSGRSISYEYGEFDDLTGIGHNGFSYNFTYDGFGNVLSTSIAGTEICTYVYADNNGGLKKTKLKDNTEIENAYDQYGRVTKEQINGKTVNSYVYDNNGNVSRQTDSIAKRTNKYEYNDSNKVVRSEVYTGESTSSANLESRMQYTYTQSGQVGTLSYQEKGGDIKTYTHTYATDEKPVKSILPDQTFVSWTYDSLRRSTKVVFSPKLNNIADSKKLYAAIQYQDSQFTVDGKTKKTTTNLVSVYTNKFGTSGKAVSEFTYTYDAWGNITKIKDLSGRERTYTYNEYGEITQAKETYSDGSSTTYAYTYDAGGNILKETAGGKTHTYTYDSKWKDKLISYDGKAITYDVMGRPTNYMGATMTWDAKGSLTSIKGNGKNITYAYLSNGQRSSKTVDGKTTTYHYNNGMLLSEQTGDETLRYYYDSTGRLTSLSYQKGSAAEASYFFSRNAQGDIIGVYRVSDSKLIGTYEYDLWGRPISVKEATAGIDTDGILTKNPFRYRGYYYDGETGFYATGARYYDPQIGRFISADNLIASVGSSVQGHNLFAYCFNNPVNMSDSTGYWPRETTRDIAVAGFIVASATATFAPVVAVAAAQVSYTALGVYNVQVLHYDVRKAYNGKDLPQKLSEVDYTEWRGPTSTPPSPSDACHQFSANGGRNVKFVSTDGRREVIFDKDGNIVTDPRDIGTYNVCPADTPLGMAGHAIVDVAPWLIFGNEDYDSTTFADRVSLSIKEATHH